MDNTTNEKEFQKHLEKLVGTEVKGKVVILGHKNKVIIKNVDVFYQITQGLKINELKKFGGLYCITNIQKEYWTICLGDELNKTFLNKYGKEYQIS